MSPQNIPAAPGPRLFTVESTARALRREIIVHNFRVTGIALLALLVAAALWLVLYAVCAWVLLLLLVALLDQPQTALPRGFPLVFACAAACAVAYAWLDHRLTPHDLPRDDKTPGEITADFLLALPRITLSIGGTLRAALWLGARERHEAAAFLHRLAAERRIPLHRVPLELPDPAARFRILIALQLLEVIDLRRAERTVLIHLHTSRPRRLGLPRA